MALSRDTIAILDYGSQYAHLIANRIRRMGVYAEIFDTEVSAEQLKGYKGIILSGGPNDVTNPNSPHVDSEIFALGIPMLGICYGHQLMAHALGGVVKSGTTSEYGRAVVDIIEQGVLLKGLQSQEEVWMSHGDSVHAVPRGFKILAQTADCPVSAMENTEKNFYGVQFHPEVSHTLHGMQILENFVFGICKSHKSWSMDVYVTELQQQIKEKVGDKKVFLLVSGGVDSVVTFALLEKTLGKDRVYGLHIDTGFMRKDETSLIMTALREAGFDNLHVSDESKTFLDAVAGMTDPEAKRKAIGDTFLEVSDTAMQRLNLNPDEWVMAQGTIYPDTIETGRTKHADKIKTHHNRVPAAQAMIAAGRLIEPISELYKDEVRELGVKLGVPKALIERHPFPGPGLAVRVLCSDGASEQISPDVTASVQKIADRAGLKVHILPVRSVGVQGDNRTYAHPALLTGDANWETLDITSRVITNKEKAVNRILWSVAEITGDFTLRAATLTKDRLDLTREADAIAHEIMNAHGIDKDIWQFPVVLAPLSLQGGEVIVLRPIESREAMTANFYRMDRTILTEMITKLAALRGVDAVFYDVTNKPPATIEWE